MMSWAYAWSLVVMGGYALAFPGAVTVHPPLALTPSIAPYLYVAWHGGFPLLLGAAWAPWPARWTSPIPVAKRLIVSTVTVAAAAAGGAVAVAVLVTFAYRLPVIINGLDTTNMAAVTAPLAVPLVALGLGLALHGTRRRSGPERWSTVAILVCLCDLMLTYLSRTRYSLGWYFGRSLTLVSAAVVLMAMLAVFRRLKAQAERDATIDALTGLCNRRGANAALDQIVARCRRSGAPLGVLCVDLDLFKQVNDRYGHETGDAVLAEMGRLLTSSCRHGDVVARVGGEEFLMLLPDTDDSGTLFVAEKIRSMVAAMVVPGMHAGMTASFGVAALCHDDPTASALLRRADNALYQAKQSGRNRVVVSSAPATVP
jgi:diguanylate cyclase (GGDEF)-like protein